MNIFERILSCIGVNKSNGTTKSSPNIIIKIGEEIQFKGIIYGSVGLNYILEYDNTAFSARDRTHYTSPNNAGMPGGDEVEIIYTLTAKKKGVYIIKEIKDFRGERTIQNEHIVKVKR